MADDTAKAPQESDVKKSFAWGQLFVGSILAGFSVYRLGLKTINMPPSEMLRGLEVTYETVRDFLMLPLSWLRLDLSAVEKDLLTSSIVMAAATARAILISGNFSILRINSAFSFFVFSLFTALINTMLLSADIPLRPIILLSTEIIFFFSVFNPVTRNIEFWSINSDWRRRARQQYRPDLNPNNVTQEELDRIEADWSEKVGPYWRVTRGYTLILLNLGFVVFWGTVLLLLNWATS